VNEENSGSVFHQWLKGVELANGDFVWIAEADDLADADFLAELLPAWSDPDVVMSYCQSRQMDRDGAILSEHYLDYVADIEAQRWKKPYVVNGCEEIAQALLRTRHDLGTPAIHQANSYALQLYKQFGLATTERPHFVDHLIYATSPNRIL
jgi:hypothetical protein